MRENAVHAPRQRSERLVARGAAVLLVALPLAACGGTSSVDAGGPRAVDAAVDSRSTPEDVVASDATTDDSATAPESGADATTDTDGDATDDAAPLDAGGGAGDAGLDAARDARADAAGTDAGTPSLCPGPTPIAEPPEQIYVAPGGSDMAAGTMAAPLASLGTAARRLPTGGTIIVRGGTYGAQHVAAVGTATHPLVIRAAAGEVPVFDGRAVTGTYGAVIALSSATHAVFEGLEIGNCHAAQCTAIQGPPVTDLAVVDCHLHDLDGTAARFAGSTIRFEGNHIHDVALTNVNNTAYPDGGWPTCMGTTPDNGTPTTPLADGVVIRNNRIENCWGEGIGLWYASNAVVEGNVVVNSFSVGIYLDNSRNVTLTRNFVQLSRGIHGSHGSGILLGTEPYSRLTAYACSDVTITDNVIDSGVGISWWRSGSTAAANTYQRVSVIHNTVVATAGAALGFTGVATGAPAPSGCVAQDNGFAETSGAYLTNASGWSLASNAWINGARPSVAGATDVTVSATIGTITTAADVEPLASVLGAGLAEPTVPVDYACNPRSATSPRRGAFER